MSGEDLLPPELEQRIGDEAAMWRDLLMGHLHAQLAAFYVTRRVDLFMRVSGLPLAKALDALGTDEAGWNQRLDSMRAQEAANRAAYRHRQEDYPDDSRACAGSVVWS